MYEELALYIDGEFRQGSGGAGEDVINPATEEALAFLPTPRRTIWTARSHRPRKGSGYGATPPPMTAARCCGRPAS